MTSAADRLCLRIVALLFILMICAAPMARAQVPLLMAGKQATYQRVLTKPGAARYDAVDGTKTADYTPFQPLYVYAVQGDWRKVGPSVHAGPEGWVKASDVVDWKQNIVAAFTNPSGRSRQILFDSKDELDGLMNDEEFRAREAAIVAEADTGHVDPAEHVVAVEPAEFINIKDKLYLMPILSFEETMHPLNYEPDLLMEVASVPLENPAPAPVAKPAKFDAGVVFVLDTTKSMGPYIKRTQRAVERIVTDIQGTDIGASVQFGVIGFRANPAAGPGIDYRTKMLATLKRRTDQTEVVTAIRDATAVATGSTPGFNEDSMAGMEDAVDAIDWSPAGQEPFAARYVILVTDAGPDSADDPNARSRIGPAELQADAEVKGVALMTLHLLTAAGGKAQHEYAAAAYRKMSVFNGTTFYYPIQNGDEAAFSDTISRMVASLTDTIRVAKGHAPVLPPDKTDTRIANLGLAMRLAFLGAQPGVAAPAVLRGWVSEKAVEDPAALAVEPRLLVTKNELATMADLISGLLDAGEQTRSTDDADAFFTQVQGVIARMAQNPDRVVNASAETPSAALEFLDDLPYRSQMMSINQQTWSQSAVQRRAILDGMRQKLTQYRKWLLDPAVWTPLFPTAADGEYVFAMPFDVLP